MRLRPMLVPMVLLAACAGNPGGEPPAGGSDVPPAWTKSGGKALEVLAGSADGPGTTDGPLASARFELPRAIAISPTGALFVADSAAATLRRLSMNGTSMTWAGAAGDARVVDGMLYESRLNSPQGLAFDEEGNLFVTEAAHVVRKFGGDMTVHTVAGRPGASGSDDGTGEDARFADPRGIAIDGEGTIFIADSANSTIREVSKAGVVTTLAGSPMNAGSDDGVGEAARFNYPEGLALTPDGKLLVADGGNSAVRLVETSGPGKGTVTTIAGKAGEPGDADGAASEARFNTPRALAVGADGALYIADSFNNKIRRMGPDGQVTTIAGPEGWSLPSCIGTSGSAEAVVVYACDSGNSTVRKIAGGTATVFAGSAPKFGIDDGTGQEARFSEAAGLAQAADGSLIVVDSVANTLRKVTREGVVTTAFGKANEAGLVDGTGTEARFSRPSSVVRAPDGSLFVADSDNHRIRKIAKDGTVSTYAGSDGERGGGGFADGPALEAKFDSPQGLAVDREGNLYVADARNQRIRRISTGGQVTTIAGDGFPGAKNGGALQARFNYPQALVFDKEGRLVVSDMENHLLRVITFSASGAAVDTLAGNTPPEDGEPIPGFVDGTGTAALFNRPLGLAPAADGAILVADRGNAALRRVTAEGVVTTLAGRRGALGLVEGPLPGSLPEPVGIALVGEKLAAVTFTTGVLLVQLP